MEIAKANLRHNFPGHFAMAVVLIVLTPVLFGTTELREQACAVPLEMFFSLIGIVLLTPVFTPEQNPQIAETVAAKYISCTHVYFIRTIYSILAILGLTCIFVGYLGSQGCEITVRLVMGTVADGIFLGALGFISGAVSGNTAVSYMVPMVYYGINYAAGNRLGRFYLFSMTRGDYAAAPWLLGSGIILLAAGILIKWKKG